MMPRPAYTVSLFAGLVKADSGFVVAPNHLRDTFGSLQPLWDTDTVFTAFTGGKANKLYMVDTDAQAYRAFRLRVEADGGFVVARKHTTDILEDSELRKASIATTMSAGKAGKLYAFTPLSVSAMIEPVSITQALGSTTSAYRIGDIPEVSATYVTEGGDAKAKVKVELGNQRSAYRATFYEAVGILNTFDSGTNVAFGVDELVFDHTEGNLSDKAYKYKVSYFIEGNINGSPVVFEGSKSEPVYLLGRQ